MKVSVTMEKLQQIVYYVTNAQISRLQRDQIHRAVFESILLGEIDMDAFAIREIAEPLSPALRTVNLDAFLRSFVDAGENQGWFRAKELYQHYVDWCVTGDLETASMSAFSTALAAAGVVKEKRSDANYYYLQRSGGDAE
ncbi:hypothetical protein DWV16_16155 [Anaerotruncus sp. AF02-27]|uniref:hypothetical protein n=1 Tax=Anaerotruncus sp. AF02-27 TaxID=2292191 RepID=UPI000E4FE225|nr:hypothetical protein [Anaerotruncus sp. AF02-27]RGX53843.1 hypothetical protein DWV16_16155 [Anaerotruncus sp. AF02-27]